MAGGSNILSLALKLRDAVAGLLPKSGGTMTGPLVLADGGTASGVDSTGSGWIRYSSGLQICFGDYSQKMNTVTYNGFSKKFIAAPTVVLTAKHTGITGAVSSARATTLGEVTESGFKTMGFGFDTNINPTTSTAVGGNYIAFGRWKQ